MVPGNSIRGLQAMRSTLRPIGQNVLIPLTDTFSFFVAWYQGKLYQVTVEPGKKAHLPREMMENTNGIWQYVDAGATNAHRLYRALQLP